MYNIKLYIDTRVFTLSTAGDLHVMKIYEFAIFNINTRVWDSIRVV